MANVVNDCQIICEPILKVLNEIRIKKPKSGESALTIENALSNLKKYIEEEHQKEIGILDRQKKLAVILADALTQNESNQVYEWAIETLTKAEEIINKSG